MIELSARVKREGNEERSVDKLVRHAVGVTTEETVGSHSLILFMLKDSGERFTILLLGLSYDSGSIRRVGIYHSILLCKLAGFYPRK